MIDGASKKDSHTSLLWTRVAGHLWTAGPSLFYGKMPPGGSQGRRWSTEVTNEFGEPILHTGAFCDADDGDGTNLVVVLHGLGGTVHRGYCLLAAAAARQSKLPCLRLALRGADGVGRDIHHAGFVDDLQRILRQKPWDRYERIALVGYSLGGHVALTAATRQIDERLAAVAAVCPPLNLAACQQRIDAPWSWVYRHHLLQGLKRSYRTIAQGRAAPTPNDRVQMVKTLREWDSLTVVPRFGFADVDEYYATQSVGPRLVDLQSPSLVVASPGDPIVPAESLRGPLARASSSLTVRWIPGGGHVFFPPGVDMGFGGAAGLEGQIMAWLRRQLS